MQIQFVWLLALYQHCQGNSGVRRKAPQWELPRNGPSFWVQQQAKGNIKGDGREQSQRRRRRRQSRRLPRARNCKRATKKQLTPNSLIGVIKVLWVSNTTEKCLCARCNASLQGDQVTTELVFKGRPPIFFSFLPPFLKNQTTHDKNKGESQFLR